MWDAKRQLRLEVLLQEKEQGTLSEAKAQELQSLTADRMQAEAEALESSTRRISEAAEQTRAEVREIEAQRRDLEESVRERVRDG